MVMLLLLQVVRGVCALVLSGVMLMSWCAGADAGAAADAGAGGRCVLR
jgi:preprotein translocase subunit SecG